MSEKETPEFEDVNISQEEVNVGKRVGVKDFISGKILTHEAVVSQMSYIVFLAIIAIFYIANNYRYDNLLRKEQRLRKEVQNLRAESITTAAKLMSISRQSKVLKIVKAKGLDLEESTVPPKKLN